MIKYFFIICAIVFSSIGAYLFAVDCMTIDQALDVQIKVRKFCADNNRYPSKKEFYLFFESDELAKEWYYFPGQRERLASYQYPMTFPIPWAPGKSKLSEFIPVIYANVVVNPCGF